MRFGSDERKIEHQVARLTAGAVSALRATYESYVDLSGENSRTKEQNVRGDSSTGCHSQRATEQQNHFQHPVILSSCARRINRQQARRRLWRRTGVGSAERPVDSAKRPCAMRADSASMSSVGAPADPLFMLPAVRRSDEGPPTFGIAMIVPVDVAETGRGCGASFASPDGFESDSEACTAFKIAARPGGGLTFGQAQHTYADEPDV